MAYGARTDEVLTNKQSGCSRQAYPIVLVGSNVAARASGSGESCPLSRVGV
jgi:hypothetical protein